MRPVFVSAVITSVHWSAWAAFVACILVFLALDLGVFHRHSHVVKVKEAFGWTLVWFAVAMLFAGGLVPWRGKQEAVEFVTGYIIELSLSMDNVFVIALIFAHFHVPDRYQHRVLFWGILGALIMRGLMIWLGVELVQRFDWLLVALGAFLIFSGLKMVFTREKKSDLENSFAVRLARKLFPVTHEFAGQKFVIRLNGAVALTPLALVLVLVEATDLIFATDSIPAIFAVTTDPFIVFTSNVFAILGLRSLYFVLAGAIQYFRYLKLGLSVVLVFIGFKMVAVKYVHIPTSLSLVVVILILAASILASVAATRRETKV